LAHLLAAASDEYVFTGHNVQVKQPTVEQNDPAGQAAHSIAPETEK
jgi:hypothetical protein